MGAWAFDDACAHIERVVRGRSTSDGPWPFHMIRRDLPMRLCKKISLTDLVVALFPSKVAAMGYMGVWAFYDACTHRECCKRAVYFGRVLASPYDL